MAGVDGGAAVATIVMYHIVRPGSGLAATLKGLDADAFRGQLEYVRAHYTPVSLFDLADAAEGLQHLPPRPVVLTFDDGYAGHHDVVFPLLVDTRTPATFFAAASSMLDRHVLDVNKVQLTLAACGNTAAILSAIDGAIDREAGVGGASSGEFRKKWWTASRWDSADVVYIKRLLQHALPERVRRPLIDDLFRRFVSDDEAAVAAELYMSAADASEMQSAGMTIGAHGDRHLRLSTLSRAAQAIEIDGALRVLDAVGTPRPDFAYCYANGEHNEDSLELLRERACRIAVTTRPNLARVAAGELLTLPRLDTNDLPFQSDAEPNEWTRRASAEMAP
jgi:peptidoglycan/xylan/chitin deacetylase (PgdA/CDA1 family)